MIFLNTTYGADKSGTVVEELAGGAAFEVEFSDASEAGLPLRARNGRTYESIGLRPDQIMVLQFEPVDPELTSAMMAV